MFRWTGPGTLDLSNELRQTAPTEQMIFKPNASGDAKDGVVQLAQGAYMVQFHELLDTPLDVMGHVYSRSSLWRSGGLIQAGVIDSGHKGAFGALLQVSGGST